EHPGQCALGPRAGKGGRRIVSSHSLIVKKAEKPAKRCGLSGDRRPAELKPGLSECRKLVRTGIRKSATKLLGSAGQVAAIGQKGIAGGPGFGRHHFQERRDKPTIIAAAHNRVIASA